MLEIIFYIMGALLSIGLLAKLISTITIRKMVKEAAEIQKSNHKLMKLIKAKFEHASLVSDRVQNVGAFVDKYIYEYKVLGIRLNTWRSIPNKISLILLILGVFSVCESIRTEGITAVTVEYVQWTSVLVILLACIHFVSGEKSRLQAARNYIVEHLENVCIHRYAKRHGMETEEIQTETMQVEPNVEETLTKSITETEELPKEEQKSPIVEKISEEEERSLQEMRIRAILEEFLA